MPRLAEGALDVGADALRRRTGEDAAGKALKLLKTLELHVELVVGHGGVVFDIVLVAGPRKRIRQRLLIVGVAFLEVFQSIGGYRFHCFSCNFFFKTLCDSAPSAALRETQS